MSGLRRVAALALLALAAACGDESGPAGPGSFTVSLEVVGPTAGAVMFDVTGSGVLGFEGTGDTRVFSAEITPTTGEHRVIAVSATGVTGFRVQVAQVELGAPQVVVVDAADTDNRPRGPAGLSARISN